MRVVWLFAAALLHVLTVSKLELRTMSTVGKLAVIALFIEICVQPGRPQQCSADRLPDFRNTVPRTSPERDRFQAIVPAYRFQCSGRVAEWRACVQPGGNNEEYFIQFQVWRPTGTEGCYELVGYNEPPVNDRQDESGQRGSRSTNPPVYGIVNPVDHCVVLTVRENEQIDFQPGDIVGYYVAHFRYGNMSDGGIQWIEDSEVVVHYREDLSREDIKSQYALNGVNPTECGFPLTDSNIYTLSDSSSNAPIISLSLASSSRPPVLLPTPTAPSAAPSATTNPSTSSSCSTQSGAPLGTANACVDTLDDAADDTKRNIPVTVAILIIITATVTITAISVLLWLRKRNRDVITDHSADIKLESNSAYNTVNVMDTNDSYAASSVPTSPNIAYQTPSKKSMDIGTSANEAYVSTDVPTFANAAYQPLKQPIQNNNDPVYEYVCPN